MMTGQAVRTLEESDVIVGYPVYLDLLGERFRDKERLSTPMRQEVERCRMAYEKAMEGKTVSLICSGDAGVYGLASLMYELSPEYPGCELVIVPGITAANSGAALLGAPLNHDYCVISLSDLLTPLPFTILPAASGRTIFRRPATSCWSGRRESGPAAMWKISAVRARG